MICTRSLPNNRASTQIRTSICTQVCNHQVATPLHSFKHTIIIMSSVAAIHLHARGQKARSARSSVDMSASSTPSGTARPSTQESRSSTPEPHVQKSHSLKNAAQKVFQAVKEHHQKVNSAFDAMYGTHYYTKQDALRQGLRS